MSLHVHRHVKPDGRELLLYGRSPHVGTLVAEQDISRGKFPHLRWHPLRQEWVVYAAARQGRTFLPQADECPLCAARGDVSGEVPFADFEIAVFENRFPALAGAAAFLTPIEVGAEIEANGRCEVVIYSPDHEANLGTLSDERLGLLIDVWGDRVKTLRGMGYPSIMPFENRGEEIGVTLHHPHGQIYAFPFVPVQLLRAAEAQAAGPVVADVMAGLDPALKLLEDDAALSFVPPFAMYPYEIWLAPKRRVASPDLLDEAERLALAHMLGGAVRRLDALFDGPMPYIMVVQTAPAGFEDTFHMTIEIRPFRRDKGKLKYLAGVEQGSGVFLVDVAPEEAAQRLRDVLP